MNKFKKLEELLIKWKAVQEDFYHERRLKMKLSFDILSSTICSYSSCKKQIKQRLTEKQNPNTLCYTHWKDKEVGRGHYIDHRQRAKRVRLGLKVKRNLLPPA